MPLLRTYPTIALSIFCLFAVSACKKDSGPNSTNNSNTKFPPPTAAAIGTASGTAVSQDIGSAGGSIVSGDGTVELEIPAGALTGNTTITMQPISNTCPGGLSGGFRFGPDGLHFSQPATLKIHYTADMLSRTLSDFMGIGYQDSIGYWHRIKQLSNDTVNMVLTASIKHFTDYAPFSLLIINPGAATLRPGTTQDLTVEVGASDDDDLPPLPVANAPDIDVDPYIIVYQEGKCNWEINGSQQTVDAGQFITDNGTLKITYQAPEHVPSTGNPVAVSATIDMGGMKLNGKKYNKTILVSNINISETLVFTIDIEMEVEGTALSGSPEFPVDYKDGVIFQVAMSYDPKQALDTALVSGFANRGPSMEPTYWEHKDGSLSSHSYTWVPDTYGEINIVSGSGYGYPGPDEEILLNLVHQGTSSPLWKSKICAYNGCAVSQSGGAIPGFPISLAFPVSNEPQFQILQKNNDGTSVMTATITPQH